MGRKRDEESIKAVYRGENKENANVGRVKCAARN